MTNTNVIREIAADLIDEQIAADANFAMKFSMGMYAYDCNAYELISRAFMGKIKCLTRDEMIDHLISRHSTYDAITDHAELYIQTCVEGYALLRKDADAMPIFA